MSNLLHNRVFPVKLHKVQTHQSLVCGLGIEETHLEKLHCQLILADFGINILLLGRNLDVKYRQPIAHILPEIVPLVLWLDTGIAVTDKLLHAILSNDAELSGHIIKLTD